MLIERKWMEVESWSSEREFRSANGKHAGRSSRGGHVNFHGLVSRSILRNSLDFEQRAKNDDGRHAGRVRIRIWTTNTRRIMTNG